MRKKPLKQLVLALLLVGSGCTQAQQSIVNAGGNGSGSGGSTAYSVGQVVYTTNTNINTGSVAQGVQQPYEIQTVLGNQYVEISLQMSVYPNPTQNSLSLEVKQNNIDNMQYQLFDLNGRLLVSETIVASTTPIEMARYAEAVYLLKVIQNNIELKTFKIIKKQ